MTVLECPAVFNSAVMDFLATLELGALEIPGGAESHLSLPHHKSKAAKAIDGSKAAIAI